MPCPKYSIMTMLVRESSIYRAAVNQHEAGALASTSQNINTTNTKDHPLILPEMASSMKYKLIYSEQNTPAIAQINLAFTLCSGHLSD